MRQISRVKRAIEVYGARTSSDVSDITGIPMNACSSYLCELERQGVIKAVDYIKVKKRGIPAKFYVSSGGAR